LVLQVVRVLPRVADEKRRRARERAVLMVHERERDEALSERLPREKTPARSFDRDGRRGELLLERLERSEVALDLIGDRARRLAAAARLHVLPVLHVV